MPDALKVYKQKRNFSITSEPAEGGEPCKNGLSFVIQKHWASRLHYDFRLELDGSMKSWAVPKGPSYDTRDKRMAVHVEDHPISYNEFEGTIPEKQYGAGKVIIWDKGTWEPLEDPRQGYEKGSLKFEMHGHKMHGKWALVRIKNRSDEKQEPWLLIKEKDDFARPVEEFSVVDEMPDSVRELPLPPDAIKPAAAARPKAGKRGAMPAGAAKAALPAEFAPELATLVDKPPTTPQDWVFEVKFDGYRMLARVEGKSVRLITRNGNDWTDKLKPLQQELLRLKLADGWYDGEIVVNDEQGRPNFGMLQLAFDGSNTAQIVYFIFDAPFLRGYDLREVPLDERRALLQAELEKKPSGTVRFSAEFGEDPVQLMEAACKLGLEGVIGKRRDSRYVSRRSPDWIKLKCQQRQEFVIGGYTDPQGSRMGFGSLILGYHDKDGVLQYAGNVGTGFNDTTLRALMNKLNALATDENPFPPKAVPGRKNHWVKPKLIAEVSFSEWTKTGSIRHPSFQGLRTDKPAKKITREEAKSVEQVEPRHLKAEAKAAPATTLPPTMKVTHGERVVDPSTGVTKLELVRYYALVGELMLEHLKGRPLALVRAPAGVGGELFFQKHADVRKLPGVVHMPEELDPGDPPMLEIVSVEGILSAAQWNVVEFHTQNATRKAYQKPDRMVFDLDPGEGVQWKAMQEAAQLMHAFLDQLGLPAFLKTSGGKGLHVVVPVKGSLGWDEVKGFSQAVVRHLASTLPDRFAFKSGARNRVGKIFIDYLRNGQGATTASAWSARVRPGLGISVPVAWDELAHLKSGDQWNVQNAHTRLDKGNEPWAGYAKAARTLTAAMKQLGFSG
ncbi:DNA ligase D [Massilia solisilvae]|uniref:DNA ligase (ATP) n=1 Tax=Massilia solisilvae TaxID=1811225 RepID=A0ABT2BM16_9BURK|nr:DNA ligase D [Massilia solisilvae]MCS0609568.1 DNA ligase D [Massilia solisilvae]